MLKKINKEEIKITIKINKNFDLIPLNKNYIIGNYYIYFGDNNHQIIKLKNIEVNTEIL